MDKTRPIGVVCICSILLISIACGYVYSKEFYVDPVNGSMSNDGSYDSPWRTLQEVFENNLIEVKIYAVTPYANDPVGVPTRIKNQGAPVKSGDTIYLRSGYHGQVWMRGAYNDDYIKIWAQEGHTPKLRRIFLSAASKWHLKGLTLTPSADPEYQRATLVHFESHGWHGPSYDSIIEDCILFSVEDISSWTADDWNAYSCRGIGVYGKNYVVRNNSLRNVNFGIVIGADHTLVEKNSIVNIGGDGMVGSGDFITIQYNTIKNFFKINENHDDGIQFHRGTNVNRIPMRNVVLRGNIIIGNDKTQDNPLIGSPQGIGCFDNGMHIDWLVENNVVIVDHWHGISVYGAKNSKIINNTVYNPYSTRAIWISLGSAPENCTVRNNISVNPFSANGTNIVYDHNISLRNMNPSDYFVDYENMDYRLKPDSPAVDAGTAEHAPSNDISGTPRPYGAAIDVGAYEYDPNPARKGYPRAFFYAIQNDQEHSLDVYFDASASGDADGYIASYNWNFGDGSGGTGRYIKHTFPQTGSYTIVLTVTDNDGKTAEYSVVLYVTDRINALADDYPVNLVLKCLNNIINPRKGQSAIIRVELPERQHVVLELYDTRGRKIITFFNGELPVGNHRVDWDGREGSGGIVGSGTYILHLNAGGNKQTKKIVVVK